MHTRARARASEKAAITAHNAAVPLLSLPPEIIADIVAEQPLQSLWVLRSTCGTLRAAATERLRTTRVMWISEGIESSRFLRPCDQVYEMSLINGDWVKLGRLPVPRRRVGCCLMTDGRIALGGGDDLLHDVTHRTSDAMSVTARGLHFDALPLLRSKRECVAVANTAAGLLAAGGFWQLHNGSDDESEDEASSRGGYGIHNESWVLRPRESAWTRCADLPFGARESMASCALPDGRAFVAGGITPMGGPFETSNTAAIFSIIFASRSSSRSCSSASSSDSSRRAPSR